ncbi:MAG TPA: hypothetical protein VFN74_07165, partial [Chloroflexota bacterium]|nr:hypothetical protein [Chloroflexota bacterium]
HSPDEDGDQGDAPLLEEAAKQWTEFARDDLGVPPADILTTEGPTSPEAVREMINTAKARGCKRLFLFIAAHGGPTGIDLTKLGTGDVQGYSYGQLGDDLEAANDTLDEVYTFIYACKSGAAHHQLQGRGFDGEVVSATDEDKYCVAFFDWAEHPKEFREAWRERVAADPAARLDFFGANQALFAGLADPLVTVFGPESHRLYKDASPIQLPDVVIRRAGESVTVMIPRPEASSFPGDRVVAGRVRIADPSIAAVDGDVLWSGVPGIAYDVTPLEITGLAVGQTEYTVDLRGQGYAFAGRAKISVGIAPTPTPGPSPTPTPTPRPALEVSAISAALHRPYTVYRVEVRAANNAGTLPPVTYRWTLETPEVNCRNFGGANTQEAIWEHGGPGCNHQTDHHPGKISVTVTDTRGNSVTRVYENGSAPGVGGR